jgi:hypothetical protein
MIAFGAFAELFEFSTSSTVIGAFMVARGFFAAHSRCTTATASAARIATAPTRTSRQVV